MARGQLLVCATPIGNLGDVSERLREALTDADVVFAEDTRRTAKLLDHLDIRIDVVSLFAGNEQSRTQRLVSEVASGKNVVLVSDAGMPTISDPGASAVRAVREAGNPVTVIPGPSAATTALALSGFGGDRFVFEGFLPRRGVEREQRLREIGLEERAVVLFASPNRLPKDLDDLKSACGDGREIAVTRELTKLHEESWVGSLESAVQRWPEPVKGEVTLVLGPWRPEPPSEAEAIALAHLQVGSGASVSDAAKKASDETGVSRRIIYEALIDDQDSN